MYPRVDVVGRSSSSEREDKLEVVDTGDGGYGERFVWPEVTR